MISNYNSVLKIKHLNEFDSDSEFTTFGGNRMSEKFLGLYQSGHFAHWVLDVAKHRICFLANQVEDQIRPSSHQFSSQIFQKICQVMVAEDIETVGKIFFYFEIPF